MVYWREVIEMPLTIEQTKTLDGDKFGFEVTTKGIGVGRIQAELVLDTVVKEKKTTGFIFGNAPKTNIEFDTLKAVQFTVGKLVLTMLQGVGLIRKDEKTLVLIPVTGGGGDGGGGETQPPVPPVPVDLPWPKGQLCPQCGAKLTTVDSIAVCPVCGWQSAVVFKMG